MAVSLEEIQAWLPPAQEELLMDTANAAPTTDLSPSLMSCFPSEFPYELHYSPVESVLDSTETDEDEDDDHEDEEEEEDAFLAGLTRRLTRQQLAAKSEKKWAAAWSPESTLCGMGSCWSVSSNGSPKGGPSPPTTPFGGHDDTWDRIYAAAGQVARLKLMSQAVGPACRAKTSPVSGTLLPNLAPRNVPPRFSSARSFPHNAYSQLYQKQLVGQQQQDQLLNTHYTSGWGKQQHYQVKPTWQQQIHYEEGRRVAYENGRCIRPLGLPPSAWSPLHVRQPNQLPQRQLINHSNTNSEMRAVLGGSATGVKRKCAGTGVFLPRRFGNNPIADSSTKKKIGYSTALLPAKVVQALNLNLDNRNMQGHSPARFNRAPGISEHDVTMARGNANPANQMRSLRTKGLTNHQVVRWPQEWTY